MQKKANNYAFIDSQNVNLAIRDQGWKLDWKRFRIYLKEKYGVTKAFLFIGYIDENTSLYTALQVAGFICIFKPTLTHKDGTIKGNCDAELVLQAMHEFQNYERAVIVTGDGDFYCLVQYWLDRDKLERVLVPNYQKYSALLKRFGKKQIDFMNGLRAKLEYKKKRTP